MCLNGPCSFFCTTSLVNFFIILSDKSRVDVCVCIFINVTHLHQCHVLIFYTSLINLVILIFLRVLNIIKNACLFTTTFVVCMIYNFFSHALFFFQKMIARVIFLSEYSCTLVRCVLIFYTSLINLCHLIFFKKNEYFFYPTS